MNDFKIMFKIICMVYLEDMSKSVNQLYCNKESRETFWSQAIIENDFVHDKCLNFDPFIAFDVKIIEIVHSMFQ